MASLVEIDKYIYMKNNNSICCVLLINYLPDMTGVPFDFSRFGIGDNVVCVKVFCEAISVAAHRNSRDRR